MKNLETSPSKVNNNEAFKNTEGKKVKKTFSEKIITAINTDKHKKDNEKLNSLRKELGLQEEMHFSEEQIKKAELFINAERALKVAEEKKIEIEKIEAFPIGNSTLNIEKKNIQLKAVEIDILRARGDIFESSESIDNKTIEQYKEYIKQNPGEKIIGAESEKDKEAYKYQDKLLSDIDSLNKKALSYGYTLEKLVSIQKYNESTTEKEHKILDEIDEYMKSLEIEKTIDKIKENNPNIYLDSVQKIKESFLKKSIIDDCLSEKDISYNKLVNITLSDIITEENYKEITEEINTRLIKDKQEALKKLPVLDIVNEWSKDTPKSDYRDFWNSDSRFFLTKKISSHIDSLIKERKFDEIEKIESTIQRLEKENDGIIKTEEILPGWLRNSGLYNNEIRIKLITNKLNNEDFEKYFKHGYTYIPFELIPKDISDDEKLQYYNKIFYKEDFSAEDLKLYTKTTGVNIYNTISKYPEIFKESIKDKDIREEFSNELKKHLEEVSEILPSENYDVPKDVNVVIDNLIENPENIKDYLNSKKIIDQEIKTLFNEDKIDKLKEIYLNSKSKNSTVSKNAVEAIYNNTSNHLTDEHLIMLLDKKLPEHEFGNYFSNTNKYIPFSLIPDDLDEDRKIQYYNKIFYKENFSAEDLKLYLKTTNNNLFETISKNPKVLEVSLKDEKIREDFSRELEKNIDMISSMNKVVIEEEFSEKDISSVEKIIDNLIKNPYEIEKYSCKKDIQTRISSMLNEGKFDKLVNIYKKTSGDNELNNLLNKSIGSYIKNNPSTGLKLILDEDIRKNIFETIIENTNKEDNPDLVKRLKNINESFFVSSNPEKLPLEIQKTIETYKEKYGEKGKNLIALAITAYGIEKPKEFNSQMEKFQNILDLYKPENIPDGAHVSMGFEYEVTNSIANDYNNGSALGYKADILLVSNSANIGIGRDAVHEIASKPTFNPYMIMAEMKLLQDAEFLDLNHEKYKKSARGHHLSLVGESGLRVNKDMYFLNNVMTMAQLTGVTTGKQISRTKDVHTKSFDYFENTKEQGDRVELKGMSPDGVEVFEKTILTAHNAGIATQVCNKYLTNTEYSPILLDTINNPEDFEKEFLHRDYLSKPFETTKERDIAFSWLKFKKDTVNAINQHNESFISSEFYGSFVDSNGEYIENNINPSENRDRISKNKDELDRILNSDDFKNKIKLDPNNLFTSQSSGFVNSLIEINNVFLKESYVNNDVSSVNAFNVLNSMKKEGYKYYDTGDFRESIFDTGEMRDGYYVVQGASEEMITQKSQILLNRFNKEMERALNQTESKKKAEEVFA